MIHFAAYTMLFSESDNPPQLPLRVADVDPHLLRGSFSPG